MLAIPITLLVAVFEAVLGLYLWRRFGRFSMISVMLFACSGQAVVLTLAWQIEHPVAMFMRPIGASVIPPLTWLAYISATMRQVSWRDGLHIMGPFCVLILRLTFPAGLDGAISLLFAGYGIAILWHLKTRQSALAKVYFNAFSKLRRLWTLTALLLLMSALMDVLIFAVYATGAGEYAVPLVNVFFVIVLAYLGYMLVSGCFSADIFAPDPDEGTKAPEVDHLKMMGKLDQHLRKSLAHLEPELTLNKLARQMHVPINDLSRAVNATTGENISRYINARRVEEAQRVLAQGSTVIDAMLESGFQTKSNFNREFKRIAGVTPMVWQANYLRQK